MGRVSSDGSECTSWREQCCDGVGDRLRIGEQLIPAEVRCAEVGLVHPSRNRSSAHLESIVLEGRSKSGLHPMSSYAITSLGSGGYPQQDLISGGDDER